MEKWMSMVWFGRDGGLAAIGYGSLLSERVAGTDESRLIRTRDPFRKQRRSLRRLSALRLILIGGLRCGGRIGEAAHRSALLIDRIARSGAGRDRPAGRVVRRRVGRSVGFLLRVLQRQ